MATRPLLSIVSPVYNERENVERLLAEIRAFFGGELSGQFAWEVLFVDDGSTDGSTEVLKRLAQENANVRVVIFSRNFGKQAALSAGYRYARGDAVLTVDSDLQHPVEALGEMVAQWQAGYDVVYGVRESHDGGLVKRACSWTFYRFFNLISATKVVPGVADFRLVSRPVVESLKQLPERCRWSPGLIQWLGFRSAEIQYQQGRRAAGEVKYSFLRSLGLAVTALTSFTTAPLRVALVLGMLLMLISIGYLTYCLVDWLCGGTVVRGWTSIVAISVMTQGLTLLAFGIQAEYLAKIFLEVKHRPEYVVRDVIGGESRPELRETASKGVPGKPPEPA